jgi:hypothetical protein
VSGGGHIEPAHPSCHNIFHVKKKMFVRSLFKIVFPFVICTVFNSGIAGLLFLGGGGKGESRARAVERGTKGCGRARALDPGGERAHGRAGVVRRARSRSVL